jgi:hypothetical protein
MWTKHFYPRASSFLRTFIENDKWTRVISLFYSFTRSSNKYASKISPLLYYALEVIYSVII